MPSRVIPSGFRMDGTVEAELECLDFVTYWPTHMATKAFLQYEELRQRVLAGTNLDAERHVAPLVLQDPRPLFEALGQQASNGSSSKTPYEAFIGAAPTSE